MEKKITSFAPIVQISSKSMLKSKKVNSSDCYIDFIGGKAEGYYLDYEY